jgi:hypothetical protein
MKEKDHLQGLVRSLADEVDFLSKKNENFLRELKN